MPLPFDRHVLCPSGSGRADKKGGVTEAEHRANTAGKRKHAAGIPENLGEEKQEQSK